MGGMFLLYYFHFCLEQCERILYMKVKNEVNERYRSAQGAVHREGENHKVAISSDALEFKSEMYFFST